MQFHWYFIFCVFFLYLKFGPMNFSYQQALGKYVERFHRKKCDKSCLKDPHFLRREHYIME